MSMSLAIRRELYKLRELVHFILQGAGATLRNAPVGTLLCYFCQEPLDETNFDRHGNSYGPEFVAKISIHHVDGNHENNELGNKALCHTSCHKGHHRREANLQRAALGKRLI